VHANWLAGSVAHAMRSRRLDDRRQDARPSRIFWAVSAILQALDNRSKRLMMTTREATRSVIHSKAGSSLTAVTLLLRDAVASTRFWTIKDLPGNCISVPCLPNAPPPTHQQVAIWWRVPEDAFKSIVNGMTITVVFNLRGGMPGTKGSGRHKGGTSEGSGRHKGGTSAGSGRKPEGVWPHATLPDGIVLYVDPKDGTCQYPDSENLQGPALLKMLAKVRADHRRKLKKSQPASFTVHTDETKGDEMTTPTTTAKRNRPRGPAPFGKRWNGYDWEDCDKAAAQHAAVKAKREAEGRRGPGRPSLHHVSRRLKQKGLQPLSKSR
jgi:hypothetical protein